MAAGVDISISITAYASTADKTVNNGKLNVARTDVSITGSAEQRVTALAAAGSITVPKPVHPSGANWEVIVVPTYAAGETTPTFTVAVDGGTAESHYNIFAMGCDTSIVITSGCTLASDYNIMWLGNA